MSELPTSNLIHIGRVRRDDVSASNVDAAALEAELRKSVTGEVRFDDGSRALYATDSSNYRQVPIGIVVPKTLADVTETVRLCGKYKAPLLSRGGGTSLAGQCCNVAVVLDWSKYLNQVIHIDPDRKLGTVQPGCILDDLRDAAAPHRLTFGPDPATHTHNTLGGMIGNDSCGVHSVMAVKEGHGARTADNVESMDVLLYDGTRMTVGPTSEDELEQIIAEGGRKGEIYRGLRDLRDRYADRIRSRFPDIPRRVSGYCLEQLLPENGFHVARALVGSEGTCVTILEATCQLIPNPPARSLLLLGYPDVFGAADHVMEAMAAGPTGCEGFDDLLIKYMKRQDIHPHDITLLPPGGGWLMVEFGGQNKAESDAAARRLMDTLKARQDGVPSMKLFDDPTEEALLWRVREASLGASAHVPGEPAAHPGWEDSAVPPVKLGLYLRDLRALFDKYGYGSTSLYGHFGQGCIHCRIPFDLKTVAGIDTWKRFLNDAAHLVVKYGGSLSGEHGDGQARAQLLPIMFGDELLDAMRQFKRLWDPDGKMNPGKVIDAYAVDENLRLGPHYDPPPTDTYFQFLEDGGSFAEATLRCVGVGKCRRHEGGVMCPSYIATREEEHSTRGRAHLLFEMLQGDPLHKGWKNDAVYDALDLCLACKGCTAQCPVNVDMPTYKAEFRAHYFRGRLHPRSHYAFGFIHTWARLVSRVPGLATLANLVTSTPGLSALAKWAADMEPSRTIPPFAPEPFTRWWAKRAPRNHGKPKVVLFPDTFNNYFQPETAKAAVEVLEAAGRQVVVPTRDICCGRPLYDYGFLDAAERWMRNILDTVRDEIQADLPFLFLEPSCASVFRDELGKLMPDDENARRVARLSYLLGDFLEKECPDFAARYPLKRQALVHGHCHHKTVLDFGAETKTFDKMGMKITVPEDGCCGMAGGFGFEAGAHYAVAQKCGERVLLPEVEKQGDDTILVADGFSCREMISQNTRRHALHMAEVLRMAMRDGPQGTPGPVPERANITDPDPAGKARPLVGAVVALAVGFAVFQYTRRKRGER